MIHLMRYFYSTNVIIQDEAHPLDYENYNHKDHILVIKKPFLEANHIGYFSLEELITKGWRVLWMLRDGRDVVSSMVDGQYHVEPERWIFSNRMFLKNCMSKQVLTVRYEQLVSDSEKQMNRIKDFIGQDYQDYSNWFTKVNTDDPMNYGVTPRPISEASVGNYKNHDRPYSTDFKKLLNLFGYEN